MAMAVARATLVQVTYTKHNHTHGNLPYLQCLRIISGAGMMIDA